MTEKWRAVARAPAYEVSDLGRVRRAGRVLKPAANLRGYLFVTLCHEGRKWSQTVHRIVCEEFHGEAPTAQHEVAHGDGTRTNNSANNLRWATRKENFQDRDRHGTTARGDRHASRIDPSYLHRGAEHHASKLTEETVRIARASNATTSELARRFGVAQSTMDAARKGHTWKHVAVINEPVEVRKEAA